MTGLIETLATTAVLFAFFSGIAFMVGYTAMAKWWQSEIGWARISLDFGLSMALSPTFIHVAFGTHIENSQLFAWYTISAIFFVGLVALWNLAIVARVQYKRQWRRNGGDATDRNPGTAGRH